jgi:hypothetical protein
MTQIACFFSKLKKKGTAIAAPMTIYQVKILQLEEFFCASKVA